MQSFGQKKGSYLCRKDRVVLSSECLVTITLQGWQWVAVCNGGFSFDVRLRDNVSLVYSTLHDLLLLWV